MKKTLLLTFSFFALAAHKNFAENPKENSPCYCDEVRTYKSEVNAHKAEKRRNKQWKAISEGKRPKSKKKNLSPQESDKSLKLQEDLLRELQALRRENALLKNQPVGQQ